MSSLFDIILYTKSFLKKLLLLDFHLLFSKLHCVNFMSYALVVQWIGPSPAKTATPVRLRVRANLRRLTILILELFCCFQF